MGGRARPQVSEPLKALQLLGELLHEARALPVLRERRAAPSTVYDLDYRVVVTACAFHLHSKSHGSGARIRTPRLKLLQFVAIRPWLVRTVQEWSQTRRDSRAATFTSQPLRRGFLGDRTHESLVELLIASGVLKRQPDHLMLGPRNTIIQDLYSEVVAGNLFLAERQALEALRTIVVTETMLEGW